MPKKLNLPVPLFTGGELATRGQRRAALSALVVGLCYSRNAEQAYMSRMPANLCRSAAAGSAAECLEAIDTALNVLIDAFDQRPCRKPQYYF